MQKRIYKYRLPRDGASIIIDEHIVEFLHVGAQDGMPTLWAIVNPELRDEVTEIVAWGTGWPFPDDVWMETDYVGTCEDGAGYVWHYFAATRSSDLQTEDTQYNLINYDYDTIKLTPSTSTPYITFHCTGNADNAMAVDNYDPNWTTACTGTISTDTYINGRNTTEWGKLLDMVEKFVADGVTANSASVR